MSLVNKLKPLLPILPPPEGFLTDPALRVKISNTASRMLCRESKAYSLLERNPRYERVNAYALLIEDLLTLAQTEYRPEFGPTVWLAPEPKIDLECLVWSPDVVNHMLASLVRHNTTNKRGLRGTVKMSNRWCFRPRSGKIRRFDSELQCHLAFVEDRKNTLLYFAEQKECAPRLREKLLAKIQHWDEQLVKDGQVTRF